MQNWVPADAERFGEDPIPPFAANVLSGYLDRRGLARDHAAMRFEGSRAQDLINVFGELLEDAAATAEELRKTGDPEEVKNLATYLWAIDELLHVPAIKAVITNSSLFSLSKLTTSCVLHPRIACVLTKHRRHSYHFCATSNRQFCQNRV